MDRILACCMRQFITFQGVNRSIQLIGIAHPFHTTCTVEAGRSWRVATGRSGNGNTYGPLVDLPDWSYADGRPAPLGSGQLKRLNKQKEYADYIYKTVHAIRKAKEDIATASTACVSENKKPRLKPKGGAL